MNQKLKAVFGDPVDEKALTQIENVLADDRAVAGALMADHHLGYSMPIGGVVAYQDAISPSGVGFDIACGNKAIRTNTRVDELGDLKPWMRQIQKNIAFGLGRRNATPVDDPLFDDPVWDELGEHGVALKEKARDQLGTVGSGNHYVDLLRDEDGYLWIACHFGSRGLGHTIATWFMAVAQGGTIGDRLPEREWPSVLDIGTAGGDLYVEAMRLAGEYAYAGRNYVVEQVRTMLGSPDILFEVHCHHNYAWLEGGKWVVRKGATPLSYEPAFIGGSMGDFSAVVRGVIEENTIKNVQDPSQWIKDIGALGSAPHGAGRVMSRTAAAGKLRKMWYCGNRRKCGFEPIRALGGAPRSAVCPNCGSQLKKARMRDPSTAAINWDEERNLLSQMGVVVLGGGADEAPGVYKELRSVLDHHSNINIEYLLSPIGVVMAGGDIIDPYKE